MRHAIIFYLAIAAIHLLFPEKVSAIVLTNAAQIRNLSPAQAAEAISVKLRGVVVDESAPREHALILADETASVYVFAAKNIFAPYHSRDLLEVVGVTSKGEFAPCVLVTNVTVFARGTATIPSPRPTSYQELLTGSLDAQFVEMTGVVRQIWPKEDEVTWRILLAANGGLVPVRILPPQDLKVQVDAEVTVRAICLYQFNKKRQALSPVLQMPHGRSVQIVKPAPANPFDAPVQPLDSLLQFSSEFSLDHRIHVHGVVTLCQPDSQVWIHDKSSGLRVQFDQAVDIQPGDEIDVLGFPSYGTSTPMLENAIYKKNGTAPAPVPTTITNLAEAYNYQDDFVSLKATLRDVQPVMNGVVLSLEQGATSFKAILKNPLHTSKQSAWQPGSVVRVAGICDVIYDSSRPTMGAWHPQSFQLLMRSPGDLTILKPPSWWNFKHITILLAIVIATLIILVAFLAALARRRFLDEERNRKMAEAQFSAVLAERNRLAREIHDTLAQGFTATLLQLQLIRFHANKGAVSIGPHLGRAEKLIRDSLKEARNSIWQMNPQVLEKGDLVTAIKDILEQLSHDIVSETKFEVTGRQRRLAPFIESNLLRLAQEAITNAVKYSSAKCIAVHIRFEENQFTLSVKDDGCGFDPAKPPVSEGGQGLSSMQGRAAEIKGTLQIQSSPQGGTEINLNLPLHGGKQVPP